MTAPTIQEEWNRAVQVARRMEGILREDLPGPGEGIGALAIVLASLSSKFSPDIDRPETQRKVLENFGISFLGALKVIMDANSEKKS